MSDENRIKVLRTSQIIVAALVQGVLMFGAVVFFTRQKNANPQQVLTYVGIGIGMLLLVMSAIVPGIISASQKKSIRQEPKELWVDRLAALYQNQLIIRCALLEGGAFLNLALTMIGNEINGIAAATLAVMLLLQFPTKGRIDWFIETGIQEFEFSSDRDT